MTLNGDAWRQYEFAHHRTGPIGDAIEAAHGGCGCLTAEISADGSLENLNVVFSNLDGALELFGNELEYVQIDHPVESCIVGTVVPMFFGDNPKAWAEEHPRHHTVHPVYKFIADNGLREESRIVAREAIGWSSLNYHFGIMTSGADGYLVESEKHCLPAGAAAEFSFHKSVKIGDLIPAKRIRVDDCKLASLYPIDAEQAEELKRIVRDQDPQQETILSPRKPAAK